MRLAAAAFCLFVWIMSVAAQRPDAPLYAQHGAYGVGTQEMTISGEERPLNVTVWYPADCENEPEYNYPLAMAVTVPGHACANAPIAEPDTPYPLIIFSHGSGAARVLYLWYTEHLASQGFVVMAADHPGNTVLQTVLRMAGGGQDFVANYGLRPDDVLRQIAFAETLNAEGPFAGKIDTNNIGVTGHSFGGWTALAAGGAQMDFGSLKSWCAEHEGGPLDSVCFLLPLENKIASTRNIENPSDALWPQTTDPRIKAIVPLAPWNAPILNFDGITAPTMLLVGTNDRTTIPERDAYVIYDALTAPKTLVTFDYGSHYIFVDECPPILITFNEFESCSDEVWDMARVHDLTNQVTTAFFRAHLMGDEAAADALKSENVDFPGVSYKSEQVR